MVTYEIRKESIKKSDEPHLKLSLEEHLGFIWIMCEDDAEGQWFIGHFTPRGSLNLQPRISSQIGLELDENGRINVIKEE